MTKRNAASVVVCLGALLVAGCAAPKAPFRIGVNAWPPCEIWYVAQQQGYFGSLPVQVVRFSAWTDNMASLYKGNLDLTHSSYFNTMYYSDKGAAARIVLVSDTLVGGDGLAVKAAIRTGSALKGKRVAVEVNTDEHFLLTRALASFGLAESDVTITSCTSIEAKDLFVAGEVDACFTYEPYLGQAAAEGGGTVLWTTEEQPDYMIDVLAARDDVVKKRAGDLRVVLAAWYKAQAWIAAHPSEAYALAAPHEDMSAADFGPFYESFTWFTAADNRSLLGSPAFRSRLGEMSDFLVAHKAVAGAVKIDDQFTATIAASLP
jgi:NitT/TauT family transport system substrate-binding protein